MQESRVENEERRALLNASIGLLGALLTACGQDAEPAVEPAAPEPVPSSPDAGVQVVAPADAPADVPSPAAPAVPVASCARALTFDTLVDESPHTTFRATPDSATLDWLTIGLAAAQLRPSVAEQRMSLLRQLDELALGYPTSLLDHSLQAATRARRAGAPDDLVAAVLCHRLGEAFTHEGYAELSAAMLRGYVSDQAYRVVLHHTTYADVAQRARHAHEPWHAAAARCVVQWLTPSWDRSYPSLPLDSFVPLLQQTFALPHDPYLTRLDCV